MIKAFVILMSIVLATLSWPTASAGDSSNLKVTSVQAAKPTEVNISVRSAAPTESNQIVRTDPAELTATESYRRDKLKGDNAGWITNVVLAVVTAILAGTTVLLWLEAGKQRNVLTDAVSVLNMSATAAVEVQLPLMFFEGAGYPPGQPRCWQFEFGNHGKTPALIQQDCLVFKVGTQLPTRPRYPIHTVQPPTKPRIVDPKGSYHCIRTSLLEPESILGIRTGTFHLWAFGYIDYVDFLDSKRRHGFCLRFEVNRDGPIDLENDLMASGKWVEDGADGSQLYRYIFRPRGILSRTDGK
jgi:hypothetical protein